VRGMKVSEGTKGIVTGRVRIAPRRQLTRWLGWVGYAAATWSLIYGALALYWALGGTGFPFGTANDPKAAVESILGGVQADTAAPLIADLSLVGTVAALAMVRGQASRGHGALRLALLVFAWSASVALLLVIPDRRVLVAVAYAPIFLVGAPFGWPPVNYFEIALPWPVINQIVCMAGGFLWAGTALAYGRRRRDACGNCGRTDAGAGWTTPDSAARWGRWAVYVAVVIPLPYAATRWAWALGIPLGIPEQFMREGQEIGMWWAGAALSTVDLAGVILTLGLVQRWGEVFPRWMVGLASKRVPPAMAVVPASLVSVMVTSAGLHFVRDFLADRFPADGWATTAPGLLWPVWGAALGAATVAYYYRRRGGCRVCGRGEDSSIRRQEGIGQW
jgi:hypothetical protein